MTNPIEESVVLAMDGSDVDLFPHLPYILQDLWEIGASPEVVITLLKKHWDDHSKFKVLDLGCGKGAVSIKLVKAFGCYCHGIDAVEAFIGEARSRSKALNLEAHSLFECDDIRTRVNHLRDYDVVVLGAIGPVLGDYYSTLTKVSQCIKDDGLIIIDDGYLEDGSDYSHPLALEKSVMLKQTAEANMQLIDEIIFSTAEIKGSDDFIYENIKKRCHELIIKHPDKRDLFVNYIKNQAEENEALETKLVCSTMLFKKMK